MALVGTTGPGCVALERTVVESVLTRAGDHGFVADFHRSWFRVTHGAGFDFAVRQFSATPLWALRAVCEVALWTDLTSVVGELVTPALVIAGDRDPVYGSTYQEQAVCTHLRSAIQVMIPECGHGLILEQPSAIATRIGNFCHERV
jgi:pimeloyl-ACP methyl ester carboxylesterase